MDILVVGRGIPTKKNPKLGIFEFDQAKAISKAGHNVTYLGIDIRSIRRWRRWGTRHEMRDGVKCFEINFPVGAMPYGIRTFIGQKLFNGFMIKNFTHRPDIIHAHFAKIAAMVGEYTQSYDIPLVITEHSSTLNSISVKSREIIIARKAYSKSSALISVSKALSDNIKKHTHFNSVVVPNIVGADVFYSVNKKHHKGFGFISVGDLDGNKNHDKLIEAFSVYHDMDNDSFLGIIGEGHNRDTLSHLIKKHSLTDCVTLYGKKTREEIADIFSQYDCFVLVSSRETFGVAYIEAMAAGLPVIATKCGGPEEFVVNENGLLIDVNNRQQLINAMNEICSNIDSFSVIRIREYIRNRFSEEVVINELYKIYNNILANNI